MANTTKESRRDSYDEIRPKRAKRRQLILEVLGGRQLTASEITEELLRHHVIQYYDRNFVAPRLTELKSEGLVETVGRRMCRRTGKRVAVWARVKRPSRPAPMAPEVTTAATQATIYDLMKGGDKL
jgi:hypothetical protein